MCLRSKECICDKKDKENNSKKITRHGIEMGESSVSDSLFIEREKIEKIQKDIMNNSPNKDQFND
jgi:hypothetical protein